MQTSNFVTITAVRGRRAIDRLVTPLEAIEALENGYSVSKAGKAKIAQAEPIAWEAYCKRVAEFKAYMLSRMKR